MSKYRVKSDLTELPKGARFMVIPCDVPPGQLGMFEVNGDPKHIIIGRWFPNIGGYDWIMQPSRGVRVTCPVRALGVVVSLEMEFKQITNLSESELSRFNPFPYSLEALGK